MSVLQVEKACKIVEKTCPNPHAVRMTVEAGDMVRKSFRAPGQFVHVKCGEGLLLRRPISVCTCMEDVADDLLTLVFEVRGEGTAWLAQREVGESLDILGLLGNGFSIVPGGRYLLVGGGIGVPPLLGCAQYAAGLGCEVHAALGFRNEEHNMLTGEFDECCRSVGVISDDGFTGRKGYVTELVEEYLKDSQANGGDALPLTILACGPKPMLRGVAELAARYGVDCQVSMEERMGCGVGACLVCACDMAGGARKHVCKDGPVFDAREVDWNA